MATAVFFAPIAYADSFDDQIASLRAQVNQQQDVAAAAHDKVNTLSGQLTILNAQISAIQAQLELNQAQQEQTTARIEQAKAELATKKAIMDESVRQIYQQSQVSPIEMLASSKDFSEYVDRQQYNDQIKDHIQDALSQINQLKADLEKQQNDLNIRIAEQSGLRANLQQQRAEQADLLAQAQGDAASVDANIKSKNDQIAKLKAQQAAMLQAASQTGQGPSSGSGGACDNGHGNGGYPSNWCNTGQDTILTAWGWNRECVSWAGWRRGNIGRPVPGGWGNANQWDDNAEAAGYTVDGNPSVGAIAQTDKGFYGHVAIVESVGGGSVTVSEMNYDNNGHFRYGVYSASYFEHYIH